MITSRIFRVLPYILFSTVLFPCGRIEAALPAGAGSAPAALAGRPALIERNANELKPAGKVGRIPWELPLTRSLVYTLLPAAFVWTALAWQYAWRSDPDYGRQKSRRKIIRFLEPLRRSGHLPNSATLETWCALTAEMWDLRRAAPTRNDLQSAINRVNPTVSVAAWLGLWEQAQAAIFAPARQVSPGWTDLALRALSDNALPRRSSWAPLSLYHWFPSLLAAGSMMLIALAPPVQAASEVELYKAVKFSGTRAEWLRQVIDRPTDVALQYNLGRAYEHEQAWGAAAAHDVAAFVNNPGDGAIATALRAAYNKLGSSDPDLQRLLSGRWPQRLPAWRSPAEWKRIQLFFSLFAATGWILLVVTLYVPSLRPSRRAGCATIAIAMGLSAAANFAAGRYGAAGHANAACLLRGTELRPIPSDLVEQGSAAPLLPGIVVDITKSYFGWSRIQTRGGFVGWVRSDLLVPLYKPIE